MNFETKFRMKTPYGVKIFQNFHFQKHASIILKTLAKKNFKNRSYQLNTFFTDIISCFCINAWRLLLPFNRSAKKICFLMVAVKFVYPLVWDMMACSCSLKWRCYQLTGRLKVHNAAFIWDGARYYIIWRHISST